MNIASNSRLVSHAEIPGTTLASALLHRVQYVQRGIKGKVSPIRSAYATGLVTLCIEIWETRVKRTCAAR